MVPVQELFEQLRSSPPEATEALSWGSSLLAVDVGNIRQRITAGDPARTSSNHSSKAR